MPQALRVLKPQLTAPVWVANVIRELHLHVLFGMATALLSQKASHGSNQADTELAQNLADSSSPVTPTDIRT
jgi:hypothetical protein